jgi:hypothetical protein
VSNVWSALTGQNSTTKALQGEIAQSQSSATSQQGQQLALLSKQQATTDNEAAQINKPGIGRQMLQYRGAGGAPTLGGS